jgi:hypothetical protein
MAKHVHAADAVVRSERIDLPLPHPMVDHDTMYQDHRAANAMNPDRCSALCVYEVSSLEHESIQLSVIWCKELLPAEIAD